MTLVFLQYNLAMLNNTQLQQIVWVYLINPAQFQAMLNDDSSETLSRDKKWAMSRLVERADYYTTMKLIGKKNLARHWSSIKPTIRQQYIKDAYDFVLSR